MNNKTQQKWDKNYLSCPEEFLQAAEVLRQNQHLLPEKGKALDLACGLGANAICLAENGLAVSAWDISSVGLQKLADKVKEKALIIETECRNITQQPPEPNTFDVIVVSRFLDRALMRHIRHAIMLKGLIFYQTFIKDKVGKSGPKDLDYLLAENELFGFFKDWTILFYREEGTVGKIDQGFRGQAMLIAQRP